MRYSLKAVYEIAEKKPSSYLLDHAFSLKSNYILNVTKHIMMLKRYGGKNCNLNYIKNSEITALLKIAENSNSK